MCEHAHFGTPLKSWVVYVRPNLVKDEIPAELVSENYGIMELGMYRQKNRQTKNHHQVIVFQTSMFFSTSC